jgi:D-alanyl-D-alanine carboxypeptidase
LLYFLLFSLNSPVWSYFPEESLTARAAFLMDATTAQVLYQREADLRLPPASTTKIVTAVVALENERPIKNPLKVTKAATHVPSSKLRLRPGQTISFEDLLYGLLLSSANDASLVLAEGIAGSVERFANMMTQKAREIGALNSHFTNPHGLTAPGHYSTARDMALIFNYAMRNSTFRQIVQTKTSSVRSISPGKNKRVRTITVRNHNRLLWNFEGTIGGKTGYTYAAQKCFVGGVSRDGVTLIVSILGSHDLWGDTRKLLEYGFQNYQTLKVASPPSPEEGQLVMRQEKPPSLPHLSDGSRVGASGGYIIQVASFREHERAESLQKSIMEDGYQAYLEPGALNNGDITYRVRVGPYREFTQAQEVAREIERKVGSGTIVLPVGESAEKPK